MRLTELNPHWYVLEAGGPVVGISFQCPHCQKERLGVAFHRDANDPMRDAYIMARSPETKHIWMATGDTFDGLTLSPSVDASAFGHWHGFIVAGEIK